VRGPRGCVVAPAGGREWAAAAVQWLHAPTPDFVCPSVETIDHATEWIHAVIVSLGAGGATAESHQQRDKDDDDDEAAARPAANGNAGDGGGGLAAAASHSTAVTAAPAASPPPAVYVHCKAGRGRSAAVVICYLIR
jgi:hypothetical protein